MMNQKRTIKALALALLFTAACPTHAWVNLRELWNSFKNNSQAQLFAGVTAAAASMATVAYLVYKYKYQKPAPKPGKPALATKPEQSTTRAQSPSSSTWAQFPTGPLPDLAPGSGDQRDFKHTAERRKEDDAVLTTLGEYKKKAAERALLHPSQLQITFERQTNNKVRGIAGEHPKQAQTRSPLTTILEDENAQAQPLQLKAERSRVTLDRVKKETALYSAANQLCIEAITGAREELTTEKLIQRTLIDIESRLTKATIATSKENATLDTIKKALASIETARQMIESFYVDNGKNLHRAGRYFEETYQANFAKVGIDPKNAYDELNQLGIDWDKNCSDTERGNIIAQKLAQQIQAEMDSQNKDQAKLNKLRQLGYTFSNPVTQANYDAYISGNKYVAIPSEKRTEIMEMLEKIKTIALEKKQALEKKAQSNNGQWKEEWQDVTVSGRKNPTPTASSVIVDLGKKPVIITAGPSLVHPKAASPSSTAALAATASALLSSAVQAVSSASSATLSGVSAAYSAAKAALPAASTTPVEQRPAVVINHNQKEEEPKPKVTPTVASAPQAQAAPAPAVEQPVVAQEAQIQQPATTPEIPLTPEEKERRALMTIWNSTKPAVTISSGSSVPTQK